jgi:hypothetical protein
MAIRELANSVSFQSRLKDLLSVGSGLKLIYDKVRGIICTKPDNSPVTKPPTDPPVTPIFPPISKTMPDLFKFNIPDIILAITSLIIAAIAVTNTYCLFHLNRGQFFPSHDIESGHLTPILKPQKHPKVVPRPKEVHHPKEVTFSPEHQLELHPLQSPTLSLATLPSPQPAHIFK